jgi:hypothetical protein
MTQTRAMSLFYAQNPGNSSQGFFLPAKIVGVAGQRLVLAISIPKVEQPTYGVGFFISIIFYIFVTVQTRAESLFSA